MFNISLSDFQSKPMALLFSDPHIGPGIFRSVDGDMDMLERTQGVIVDIWNLSDNLEISTIICLGDLFDQADRISVKAIDSTTGLFTALQAKSRKEFFCLTGNHDLGSRNINGTQEIYSSINVLAHANLLYIADYLSLSIGKADLYFVPYMLEPSKAMAEGIATLESRLSSHPDKIGYLCVHQTPSINSLGLPADFDGENIPHPRIQYLSGHIHKPDIGLKGRILGCPAHLSADDLGQQKYIYVLLENGQIRAIPTHYPAIRPHVAQTLKAIVADDPELEAGSTAYASNNAWSIMQAYTDNDEMKLVYIQQFFNKAIV